MGNLFGGAIDVFGGDEDDELNTQKQEENLLKECEEGPCTWIFSPKKVRLVFKKRDTEFEIQDKLAAAIQANFLKKGKSVNFL